MYTKGKASINKSTHVGQPVFSVLFALLSLAGDSPPASKRTKIPRKSKAVRCEAVLPEQKCSQTRKRPQRILCVFSRALTQYEGISARQNRVCPCQSTQALTDMPSRWGAFPNAAKAQPRSSAVCICEGSGLRFFSARRRATGSLPAFYPAACISTHAVVLCDINGRQRPFSPAPISSSSPLGLIRSG